MLSFRYMFMVGRAGREERKPGFDAIVVNSIFGMWVSIVLIMHICLSDRFL